MKQSSLFDKQNEEFIKGYMEAVSRLRKIKYFSEWGFHDTSADDFADKLESILEEIKNERIPE